MKHSIILTEKQISDLETSLNTNKQANDALISAHFANATDQEFREQLLEFIKKKKEDISVLCQQYSDTFGRSIEAARTLGSSSNDVKKKINLIEAELQRVIAAYNEHLENAVRIRQEIHETDEKIKANLEFQILIQQLRNINEEIATENYYIATVRTLEFANYDSPISNCTTILELQRDVDSVISYIETQAERKMTDWMINFNKICYSIGDAFLNKKDMPHLDMSPIYEFYMIEKQLGKPDVFLQMYNDKREKQLKFIREKKQDKSEIDSTDFLFAITAGFFWTEWKISADGFNLLEPARAEKMWSDTIGYIQRDFNSKNTHEKIEDWINFSQRISYFDERMSQCSLNSSELQSFIKKRGKQFVKTLSKEGAGHIKKVIDNSRLETFTAKNAEELEPFVRYMILDPSTTFPKDTAVIPELPKVCEIIQHTLEKWSDFHLFSQDRMFVELYEALVAALCNAVKSYMQSSSQIPMIANLVASLIAFEGALNYFENFIQKTMASSVKQDKEKLRRLLYTSAEVGMKMISAIFYKFTDDMVDDCYLKELDKMPPPHENTLQFVMYHETMSNILQMELPPKMFQKVVEDVAKHIAEVMVKVIVTTQNIVWTPNFISTVAQNVTYISNWSTLISIPSAKSYLNGLVKMLSLLTSNQLATYSSDPQFVSKNRDIPYKAMVTILQKYKPTNTKNLYVIQPNLVNSLIAKLTPAIKD